MLFTIPSIITSPTQISINGKSIAYDQVNEVLKNGNSANWVKSEGILQIPVLFKQNDLIIEIKW